MSQENARWNAVVLAVIGLLCIGVSDRPTSLSALAGGALLLAAGAMVYFGRRLPTRIDDQPDLDEDEVERWRALAEAEGTVTAVKQLRRSHPTLGLAEAVHVVNGDTGTRSS